eukprot:2236342-Pleurochrysis_carterae.AAC.1
MSAVPGVARCLRRVNLPPVNDISEGRHGRGRNERTARSMHMPSSADENEQHRLKMGCRFERGESACERRAVSYTHLTLPTILLV